MDVNYCVIRISHKRADTAKTLMYVCVSSNTGERGFSNKQVNRLQGLLFGS
jgi:hypothetical protein